MMIPDAEPIDEQPVDEKPVDEVPTPEPPAPKEKMWVRLKGDEFAPIIEVDKDATKVELAIEQFEVVKPEVWENVTKEWIAIVNNGAALIECDEPNKPVFFTANGVRWAWVDDALQVQRRKVE